MRRRADQFGQFTGRLAANQVHLEKTILTVRVTGRKSQIVAIRCAYDGNPAGIARDRDNIVDARDTDLAVECRQTCPQTEPHHEQDKREQHTAPPNIRRSAFPIIRR